MFCLQFLRMKAGTAGHRTNSVETELNSTEGKQRLIYMSIESNKIWTGRRRVLNRTEPTRRVETEGAIVLPQAKTSELHILAEVKLPESSVNDMNVLSNGLGHATGEHPAGLCFQPSFCADRAVARELHAPAWHGASHR